jgi:hypothetical protein
MGNQRLVEMSIKIMYAVIHDNLTVGDWTTLQDAQVCERCRNTVK